MRLIGTGSGVPSIWLVHHIFLSHGLSAVAARR